MECFAIVVLPLLVKAQGALMPHFMTAAKFYKTGHEHTRWQDHAPKPTGGVVRIY